MVGGGRGNPLLYGKLEQGLYRMHCWLPQVAAVNAVISGKLWHRRLGHVCNQTVQQLCKGDAVTGMGQVGATEHESCNVCDRAKQPRIHFSPAASRADAPLQLIHSDVMEMPERSLEGHRYVVTLLDDFLLGDCLSQVQGRGSGRGRSHTHPVTATVGHKAKVIRTDRGTEFLGELQEYVAADSSTKPAWSTTPSRTAARSDSTVPFPNVPGRFAWNTACREKRGARLSKLLSPQHCSCCQSGERSHRVALRHQA